MGKFTEYIGSQFGNPRGIIGKICCIIMNVMNRPMYKKTVSSMNVNADSIVLDIGYGNGYMISKIYEKYRANIYGIDISDDMKDIASKRNRKAVQNGKVILETGSCCALKYDDNFFHAVTSINTIYFWEDTEKGLKEIYRTLKDGGVFYNVVYTKEWLQKLSYTKKSFKFFDKQDYIELGKNAGFSQISIQEISNEKSFAVVFCK